ncbi:helix-turn-helix transcriptional regulator [Staphylospora marina]|uniref:helix-turn-helix transcriptional regulator n=1 Tax=Staphylospora marina TaxID=2490858 RepID=UPI000F5BD0C2|nr:helix-turn-helix transcriptional regulator [Staphylospora marina]
MKEYVFVSLELGHLIRRKRKEKGLKQEELSVDHVISTGTISNIERGAYRVSREKLEFLCERLGIAPDVLSDHLLDSGDGPQSHKINPALQLMSVEYVLDMVDLEKAYNLLRQIRVSKNDPLHGVVLYLKGRYYEENRKWSNAELHYQKAIRHVEQFPELLDTNIQAAAYNGLSRIYHHQSKLEKALQCVQLGLNSFKSNGERKHVKYHLLISKVIFLEKLNRDNEAFLLLDEIWNEMPQIESAEARLNMYDLRAMLLNKMKLYEQAILVARQGLERARVDKVSDRAFDLWTTMGESYTKLGSHEEAELCYRSALRIRGKIRKKHILTSTYIKLGLLYFEKNELDNAQKYLEQAVELGKTYQDSHRLIEALSALGDCFQKRRQMEKAKKLYEEALNLSEEGGFDAQRQNILRKLALCCEQLDPECFRKYVTQYLRLSVKLEEGGGTSMRYIADPPTD